MATFREWLRRLLGTFRHGRRDDDLAEELRLHLELAAEAARRHGGGAIEADGAAQVRSAGMPQALEALRDQRGLPWIDNLARDVRHGLRTLRRAPIFTAVALCTLALGIGANAAVFQLLDAIRLRDLPVRDPHRLGVVELADLTRWAGRRTTGYPALTNPLWEHLRDHQDAFAGVLAWANTELRFGDDPAARLRGLYVSGGFFDVLGVPPALGRVFAAADDRPGCGAPAAVVSHGFWERQLGADPRAIGRVVSLHGRPVEIVGVTPREFTGVEVGRAYDVAIPICAQPLFGPEPGWLTSGTVWWLTVMGRLGPADTFDRASARLEAMSPDLFRATLPGNAPAGIARGYLGLTLRAAAAPAGVSALRTRFSEPLTVLLAATALVLLIVCTNVASLVLSRASSRQREFAVRQALGASPTRLVQQVLTENMLLAAGGAAIGLAFAGVASRLLIGLLGTNVSVPLRTDARLVGVVILASVLTLLTCGIVPAWRASRAAARGATAPVGDRGAGRARAIGVRQSLVIAQVAVSMVLLVGALLFVATLRNLLAVDTGFRHSDVYVARIDASLADPSPQRRAAFRRNVVERIRRVEGVSAAAEVRHVPMSGTGSSLTVWLDGADPAGKADIRVNAIGEGYLQTLGIRLLAGRDITDRDAETAPKVALVTPALVRRLGIRGNPVGVRLRGEGPPPAMYEIVGLVADTKHFALREEPLPLAFLPVAQITDPRPFTDVVIRSDAPLSEIASSVARTVRGMGPLLDADVRGFDTFVRQGLVRERLMAALSSFFGVVAVLIAAVGLYGVMSELVTRSKGEIGVRVAIGATRASIVLMVLRQAGALLVPGMLIGVLLSLAAAGWTRSLVFGLHPRALEPVALACLCLVTAAMAAMLVPAYRAATLEPVAALREE